MGIRNLQWGRERKKERFRTCWDHPNNPNGPKLSRCREDGDSLPLRSVSRAGQGLVSRLDPRLRGLHRAGD